MKLVYFVALIRMLWSVPNHQLLQIVWVHGNLIAYKSEFSEAIKIVYIQYALYFHTVYTVVVF